MSDSLLEEVENIWESSWMSLETRALNVSLIIETSHGMALTHDLSSLYYGVALPSEVLKCYYVLVENPTIVFHLPILF